MELSRTYNQTNIDLGLEYWVETFDSSIDLGLRELNSQEFNLLLERMKLNDNLRLKYEFYNTNHRPLSNILSFIEFGHMSERGYLKVTGTQNWRKEHSWMYYWLFRSKLDLPTYPLVIFLEGGLDVLVSYRCSTALDHFC